MERVHFSITIFHLLGTIVLPKKRHIEIIEEGGILEEE